MITAMQTLLKKHMRTLTAVEADSDQALRMATAALLFEVAKADDNVTDAERETVQGIIRKHYSLSVEQAREIAETVEKQADKVTSLYPFTRLITRECSMEDRIGLVRQMWEVTCADGHIDRHEEYLVRKVAELLYVPHSEFIRTKLQESDC